MARLGVEDGWSPRFVVMVTVDDLIFESNFALCFQLGLCFFIEPHFFNCSCRNYYDHHVVAQQQKFVADCENLLRRQSVGLFIYSFIFFKQEEASPSVGPHSLTNKH